MRSRDYCSRLPLLPSLDAENALLADILHRQATEGPLQILEAGCGRAWGIELDDVAYTLTGVDLDADALEIRLHDVGDLDEAIVGDLRSVELEADSFDVIYNSFVLEHIAGAAQVLDNFWRWLKPGGLLILRIPDGRSVHGFTSRITPLWFHVFVKRYFEGVKEAGRPGCGPYPAVYDPVVSRPGIHAWLLARGAVLRAEYGSRYYHNGLGLRTVLINAYGRIVALLSRGRLACTHDNLTYVLQKPVSVVAGVGRSEEIARRQPA